MSLGKMVVIGGGRMGEAIVRGLIDARVVTAADVVVVEPVEARRDTLTAGLGVGCVADAAEAVLSADTVLLAVKPQVIDDIVRVIAPSVRPGAVVVSIAAGITTARLEALLPVDTPVVRVMPNTPAMVKQGMSLVSGGFAATDAHVESVRGLFASLGRAVVLDEGDQDAATAISGSGPAYVALFIDALVEAGVRQGLPRDIALESAVQTFRGTAELLERSGMTPGELIEAVSSPGGTTVAALGALDRRGFRESIDEAVAAAVARAKELGS